MRHRFPDLRTETRGFNPYRLSTRTVRGLNAVTGGRLGLDLVNGLASVLGRMERKYLQIEPHFPELFRAAVGLETFHQDLETWSKALVDLAAVAVTPIHSVTVRQHAVTAHEMGCPRFATALRLRWTASNGREASQLTEWDLISDLGHFRWEAHTVLTSTGLAIVGDQIRWETSRHYEITRLLGGAPEL